MGRGGCPGQQASRTAVTALRPAGVGAGAAILTLQGYALTLAKVGAIWTCWAGGHQSPHTLSGKGPALGGQGQAGGQGVRDILQGPQGYLSGKGGDPSPLPTGLSL